MFMHWIHPNISTLPLNRISNKRQLWILSIKAVSVCCLDSLQQQQQQKCLHCRRSVRIDWPVFWLLTMLSKVTPFNIVLLITIILGLHDIGVSSSKVIKRQALDTQQLFCIADFARGRISDSDCLNLVTDLVDLYNSFDPLLSISTQLSQFPIFCRPSCGQVIINAWQSCGAFNDIAQFANLLIGMCSTNALLQ